MDASNPYAPPQAEVHDVSLADEPIQQAALTSRLAAAIVDAVVLLVAVYVPLLVALVAQQGTFGPASNIVAAAGLFVMVLAFGAWCWVTILWVMRHGQSIGKRLLSIKVVRADGSRASLGRIFWLRNVVNGLIGIIPIYPFVDHLFIFGDARQCLHDKIADTIVIQA